MSDIRALAHNLADALAGAPALDAGEGFELGRLATMITQAASGVTLMPAAGSVGATDRPKRVRVEKRPMRRATRILVSPDGHEHTFDFQHLRVIERDGRKIISERSLATRAEVWEALREARAAFKNYNPRALDSSVNF